MTTQLYAMAALVAAISLSAVVAGPGAYEAPQSLASVVAPAAPQTPDGAAASPCNDDAYNLIGGKWHEALGWLYQSSTTPSALGASAVLTVIKRSFDNMTGANNDCGLADTVSATSTYLGTTDYKPSVTKRGRCAARDGRNVVGFGRLPSAILAVTCVRTNGNGRMTETDIRINSDVSWALSVGSCSFFEELLEPTMTHEIGHAYGLDHVGESKHGRLTMSTTSDGPCNDEESTLGLGDVLGMRFLYPL